MKIKFIKKCVWAFKTVRDDQYKVVKGHTVCFDPTDTFVDMEEGVARQMIMAGYAIEKNVSESSEKEGSKAATSENDSNVRDVETKDILHKRKGRPKKSE